MYMRIICPWACASYAMRIRCVCSWACAWNDFKTFYGRYMVHAHVHGTFLWPTCVLHSQQMRITFPCRHSPDVRIGNAMRMRITFPNWRAPRNAHAHSMRRALLSHWGLQTDIKRTFLTFSKNLKMTKQKIFFLNCIILLFAKIKWKPTEHRQFYVFLRF